jgi:hypothetical protein
MKKTNTPLTDEQVLAYRSEDGSEFVHASFAEELETKLAAMQARAEKAEARLEFLIVRGGDYVGWAETWNVSIEDLDADMAAEIKL